MSWENTIHQLEWQIKKLENDNRVLRERVADLETEIENFLASDRGYSVPEPEVLEKIAAEKLFTPTDDRPVIPKIRRRGRPCGSKNKKK